MSSANVLDQQSITRKHRRILWASGLGIFLDGYDLSIMAVALILLKQQWHLTPSELGALGTAALVGALVGGLFGGPIADRWGRKTIYLIDIAAFFFAALLSGFAWDAVSLVVLRFFLGLGVGADYPLSSTYMAEFLPKKSRGAAMTWIFGLWMGAPWYPALLACCCSKWALMRGAGCWSRGRYPQCWCCGCGATYQNRHVGSCAVGVGRKQMKSYLGWRLI